MTTTNPQAKTCRKSCANCIEAYRKDNRAGDYACKDGRNFDFKTYAYIDLAHKCKDFKVHTPPIRRIYHDK